LARHRLRTVHGRQIRARRSEAALAALRHQWSHADAFERTRQIGGLGEGIYFSHLFALLWAANAAAWWLAPARFSARSPWLDRALHGYMLFMVANGMIVYVSGPIRWAGIAMFSILPIAWLAGRRGRSSEQ
jgi:hypothetical protein